MLEFRSSITKAQITPFGAMKDLVNNISITILGKTYDAGSICFRGFAGRLNKSTGKYEGNVRFDVVKPPNPSLASGNFDQIVESIVGNTNLSVTPSVVSSLHSAYNDNDDAIVEDNDV